MLRSLVVTLICGAVVALKDPSLDMHWTLWKKNHSKIYTNEVRITSKTGMKFYSRPITYINVRFQKQKLLGILTCLLNLGQASQ